MRIKIDLLISVISLNNNAQISHEAWRNSAFDGFMNQWAISLPP